MYPPLLKPCFIPNHVSPRTMSRPFFEKESAMKSCFSLPFSFMVYSNFDPDATSISPAHAVALDTLRVRLCRDIMSA